VLNVWLHSTSTRHARRIRVGNRTVWFFRSETDAGGWWMAWDQDGRTYGAWAWINARRRALRRLKPFVESLHVLTTQSHGSVNRPTKILIANWHRFAARPRKYRPHLLA
jgi:hypothetical protein